MIVVRRLLVTWLLAVAWASSAEDFNKMEVEVPTRSVGSGHPNSTLSPEKRTLARYISFPLYNQVQNPAAHKSQYLSYSPLQYMQRPAMAASVATNSRPMPSGTRSPVYHASATREMQNNLVTQGYKVMHPSLSYRPAPYFQYNAASMYMTPFPGYRPFFGVQGKKKKIVNRVINNNMNINTGTQGSIGQRERSDSLTLQTNETAIKQEIFSEGANFTISADEDLPSEENIQAVSPSIDAGANRESYEEPDAESIHVTEGEGTTVSEQEKSDRYSQLLKEYKKFLEQSGKNDVIISGMKGTHSAGAFFENKKETVENSYFTNFTTTNVDRTFINEKVDTEGEMLHYF